MLKQRHQFCTTKGCAFLFLSHVASSFGIEGASVHMTIIWRIRQAQRLGEAASNWRPPDKVRNTCKPSECWQYGRGVNLCVNGWWRAWISRSDQFSHTTKQLLVVEHWHPVLVGHLPMPTVPARHNELYLLWPVAMFPTHHSSNSLTLTMAGVIPIQNQNNDVVPPIHFLYVIGSPVLPVERTPDQTSSSPSNFHNQWSTCLQC